MLEGNSRFFVNTKGGGNSKNLHKEWKAGDRLAISPSQIDAHAKYNSIVTISEVRQDPSDKFRFEIILSDFPRNTHTVRSVPISNGSGRTQILAPIVAKLNRNIKISGLPQEYTQENISEWWDRGSAQDGGHVVIANTAETVVIQGVEISAMGHPGIIGRYPLHMHFLANVRDKESIVKGNVVHHSKQRCIVVHATNGLRVRSNVAFRALGHCFLTEDGVEVDNQFVRNVVIGLRPASRIIALTPYQKQSDELATGFWMASPTNDLTSNMVGGASIAYWFEAPSLVRGQSRDVGLPGWTYIYPRLQVLQRFNKNSAHCVGTALKTYPPGLDHEGQTAILDRFFAFTMDRGWDVTHGTNQHLMNSMLLDVHEHGIQVHMFRSISVSDSVISGAIINEDSCGSRSVAIDTYGGQPWQMWTEGMAGIFAKNVHLQNFQKARNCKESYGVHVGFSHNNEFFPSSSQLENVTFSNIDTNFIIRNPYRDHWYSDMVGMHVKDTHSVSEHAFYLGSNFSAEKVLTVGCERNSLRLPGWTIEGGRDSYLCRGQCWRQVHLSFHDNNLDDEYRPIIVRLTSADNPKLTFDQVSSYHYNEWHVRITNRAINKFLPAGTWNVQLLDKDSNLIPAEEYTNRLFAFVRTDAVHTYSRLPCTEDVLFKVHGKPVFLLS